MNKKCIICGEGKALEDFYRDRGALDGRRKNCKACKNKQVDDWRRNNKDQWNAYMREFRKEHSGSAEWKRKASNRSLKFRYGITLDQRQAMFDAQNGCCKICLCALQPGRGTHLDHDHKTGAVRALLCFRCNHYIGHIKENMESVKRLAEYLKG